MDALVNFVISHTAMAGLTFPVSRVRRHMRGRHAPRIRKKVPIYLAAVLEYLVAEVLNQAGIAADSQKKTRVLPRHVQLAIRTDQELKELLKGVTIAEGGVMPYIHESKCDLLAQCWCWFCFVADLGRFVAEEDRQQALKEEGPLVGSLWLNSDSRLIASWSGS